MRLLALIVLLLFSPSAFAGGNEPSQEALDQGAALYQSRCGGCHSVDKNRIGPRHSGVYGRRAGSLSDYKYSKALASSEIIWDDTTLDAWLTNPGALVPGQKMGFRLRSEEERTAIIAYLKSVSQ
ncbi:MAG: c-type cytochrome [Kiloniellales bacterium]|nr:c-type cytochrome [Kiloniellales bacterium]